MKSRMRLTMNGPMATAILHKRRKNRNGQYGIAPARNRTRPRGAEKDGRQQRKAFPDDIARGRTLRPADRPHLFEPQSEVLFPPATITSNKKGLRTKAEAWSG